MEQNFHNPNVQNMLEKFHKNVLKAIENCRGQVRGMIIVQKCNLISI